MQLQDERGDRKLGSGPRSKVVEAIAVLLLARPMRAAEIAQVLGRTSRYVSSYLSYWKTRGLFEYVNGYWQLTREGEEYARNILEKQMNSRVHQYMALAKQILESGEQVRAAVKDKTRGIRSRGSGLLQPFTVAETYKADKKKQNIPPEYCIQAIIDYSELTPEEQEVLDLLLSHYMKWGTTYLYADQLQRELDADASWLLRVLRLLQTKGIIYIYKDRRLGIRIGFSKRVRSQLEACLSL